MTDLTINAALYEVSENKFDDFIEKYPKKLLSARHNLCKCEEKFITDEKIKDNNGDSLIVAKITYHCEYVNDELSHITKFYIRKDKSK